MSSKEIDTALDEQLERALRSTKQVQTPPALDEEVLNYARQHAPIKPSPRYSTWMPATAAACLAGVALLIALPLSPPFEEELGESSVEYDDVTIVSKKRSSPMTRTSAPASNSREQATGGAGLTHYQSAERLGKFNESTADLAASKAKELKSPQLQTDAMQADAILEEVIVAEAGPVLEVDAEIYKQLENLSKPANRQGHTSKIASRAVDRKNSAQRADDNGEAAAGTAPAYDLSTAAISAGNEVLDVSKDLKQNSQKPSRARILANDSEQRYQRIRAQCRCNLPPSWLEAETLLETGRIRAKAVKEDR